MAKILLVEDDALLARMYQKKLEMDNHNVIISETGPDGLKMANEMKPDLILLDVMLPEMNGFEVLENLKSNEDLKTTPVILLTNLGNNEEDINKGLELGAVAYLIKSNVVPADVVAKIKEVLSATKPNDMPEAVSVS